MMTSIRTIGLSLIAALVLMALLAATAQAKHINTGPVKFTAVSTNAPNFEPESVVEAVTCTSGTAAGEITSATKGHLTEVFAGCETEGRMCTSEGQPEGTIATEELATELGYTSKPKGEAGTDFKPVSGGIFAQFDCPGSPDVYVAIKESVVGRVEPSNVMGTTSESVLTATLGTQEIERFEGQPKDTLVFQVSTGGKVGWEKGEFAAVGGGQNVNWKTSDTEQKEQRGKKVKSYPDEVEVLTTGATPEYIRCRKAKAAKWSNSSCTEKAIEKRGKLRGHFEAYPVPS